MTRNSWRQNLHGRTSQKQTHCHDAFGTVQRNIQWIPTVNIWMVNPSVSSKLKVRYIGMKLSNFCFVSSLPTYHCSVKRISENFALLFLRILAWTSVWPFGKFANWESQFTIESWSLLNCKFEFFGKCILSLSLRPVGWWRLSTFQQFIVWKMPNNYEQFIEWQF